MSKTEMSKTRKNCALVLAMGLCVCPALSPETKADYYDNFNDGYYARDPNDPRYDANDPYWTDPNNAVLWDIDNPDWSIERAVGDTFYNFVDHGWLRLFADSIVVPLAFIGAYVEDGNHDPNTSLTFFDDSAPHYLMMNVKNVEPNMGAAYLIMHTDVTHWTTYGFRKGFHPDDRTLAFTHFNGIDYRFGVKEEWPDPNTEPNEITGFWICFQFDNEGSSDPNDQWFRGAAWNGKKYDWDGTWHIEQTVAHPNWPPELNWTQGVCGLAVAGTAAIGLTVDVACDNPECRWGVFSNNPRTLNLTVKNAQMGTITIDPDILENQTNDPNDPNAPDPNDYNEPRWYTDGTEVVLVAEAIEGKSFRSWKVFDPNHPGDSDYATVDTNTVLYVTMDGDYQIEAAFKCGSSELLAPAAMVLFVLAMGVVMRRSF